MIGELLGISVSDFVGTFDGANDGPFVGTLVGSGVGDLVVPNPRLSVNNMI